jgi:hypothetical protein
MEQIITIQATFNIIADIHDVYNYWEDNVHRTYEDAETWGRLQ